jgi:dimeric dUTPase (all-alpha-NTP-PPase superfamily)
VLRLERADYPSLKARFRYGTIDKKVAVEKIAEEYSKCQSYLLSLTRKWGFIEAPFPFFVNRKTACPYVFILNTYQC